MNAEWDHANWAARLAIRNAIDAAFMTRAPAAISEAMERARRTGREEAFEEIALALDADAKACREDGCDYDADCAEHYAKLVRELAKKPAPKVSP